MADPLNVLLIVLDGARADHVSGYGYHRPTTPFLDQVAEEGVRFSNMFATAPCTLAAHATLFTGLHSVTHGATEESRGLSGRHRLLAEHCKAAGYRTAAFCTNPTVSPETGFGAGFDCFVTQRRASRIATTALHYGRRASDRLLRRRDSGARRTNEAFFEWVAAGDAPFFAFVHYNETRLPVRPPHPYERRFVPASVAAGRMRTVNQDAFALLAGRATMEVDDYAVLGALYDGALQYVDSKVAEVAEFLKARGVWDRTLLVITADHGEGLGEHGSIGHAFGLYDTELRVPLLLRCPPQVPQGFVAQDITQHIDVMPTILHIAGVDLGGARPHGRVLLDRGRATRGPVYAVAERFRPNLSTARERYPEIDMRALDVRMKAIRNARHKFVWHSDEANELYDLVADPGETRNLIEGNAPQGEELRRQLFDWLATVEKYESVAVTGGAGRHAGMSLQEAGTVE
jgi:arylsulfatase A-like enzyme